jgi:rubrerythrin
MTERNTLMKLIKTQIEIENEHVKSIEKLEKTVGNAAAQLLLLEIRLDSTKHAGILTRILEVMEKMHSNDLWKTTLEGYADPVAVKRSIENHIKMEIDVLDQVKNEMKRTKDEGLKLLLEHIQADEEKHHEMLNTIIKNLYKVKAR